MVSSGSVAEWTGAIFLVACTALAYLLYERYKIMSVFKRLGIPGPLPDLFTGNNRDIRPLGSNVSLQCHQRWRNQYGNVFGYYRSGVPVLVVSDLELLKQLLIKDFHLFSNRGRVRITLQAHHDSLLGLRGERWKEVRKTLNPTFTASKMRQLSHIVGRKIDTFVAEMDRMAAAERGSGGFDIYEKFQRMTLDVIGECALAMTIDCQRDLNNSIFDGVRQFMTGNYGRFGFLLSNFSSLDFLLRWWINRLPMVVVAKTVTSNLFRAIAARRQAARDGRSTNTIDMLQLMLNTTSTSAAAKLESKVAAEGEQAGGNDTVSLTDNEIVGSCWAILIAGYETTATALAYAAHLLTVNQDVQQKVFEEIVANTKPDQIPTYDEAHSMQYLDQVINEALRLYPPVVLFMTRECAQDYDLNGIKIPAGMKIEIPIYSIHHDPELWPDPEKFDPERFSPENKSKIHPMAHIPFGAGPRNCIGMRFALLEAKLTLIRLLRKYRLEPCDKTKDPPDVTVPHMTYVPKNGIFVKIVLRE